MQLITNEPELVALVQLLFVGLSNAATHCIRCTLQPRVPLDALECNYFAASRLGFAVLLGKWQLGSYASPCTAFPQRASKVTCSLKGSSCCTIPGSVMTLQLDARDRFCKALVGKIAKYEGRLPNGIPCHIWGQPTKL